MRLIYLSPLNWVSFAQRPHKFVEWWHNRTGGDVLWVNPYPTRLPQFSDFKRASMKLDDVSNATPRWLHVRSSLTFPIEPIPGSGLVNAIVWRQLFQSIDQFAKGSSLIIAIGKPTELSLQLISRFKNAYTFYDAMDDFPAFYSSSLSRAAMEKRESKLVSNVNAIWVSSTKLKKRWEYANTELCLVHNGVDGAVLPRKTLINKNNKQKVLGYVGTIGRWFDWEWVLQIAKLRPKDIVRLVGPVFVKPPVSLPSNVEIEPACEHSEAIAAMQQFDVGLIPFQNNELTESVDPIKYYEYRSIGLPVVSTSFGEMAFRSDTDGVFVCTVKGALSQLLNDALKFTVSEASANRFKLENTWDVRFDSTGLIRA